jgi:hypothetical protein
MKTQYFKAIFLGFSPYFAQMNIGQHLHFYDIYRLGKKIVGPLKKHRSLLFLMCMNS